jgi:hypothetical protein
MDLKAKTAVKLKELIGLFFYGILRENVERQGVVAVSHPNVPTRAAGCRMGRFCTRHNRQQRANDFPVRRR